ncbi:phosphatase PAP2 family protein [uncultured Rhodoferax sp.]|uniref:phosphatase domain-containing putative toxin n=1 Tax=uncultured Rhodoferax sp. TaxID=223188 RepID=UPI0025EF0F40|nr:phosphatase PAP2 family protein [uncultured Rhodoferax sp.]
MTPAPTSAQRLCHLLLNGTVFGLCYRSANWFAEQQGVQRAVATAWDAQIPFLPWMLLPYALSTVFFVASFWGVATQDALRTLSQRLLLATVLACLVFVLFPLRFSLVRPVLGSAWWAALYAALDMLDRPYNQLPSLHVAYCCIFWAALRARRSRPQALALALTLTLVAFSTLFTYQHHLPDVLAGGLLGWACIALVRPNRDQPRVALYYTLGVGVVLVLGWVWLPWWLTAYGAVSLMLVARAYALGDAQFLHKRDGRVPWWSWLLHGPYLLGYCLTWWAVQWWERGQPPLVQMAPHLWVGRRLTRAQARVLPPGCTVIDLANELSETPSLRGARYRAVPLLDLVSPDAATVERVLHLMHEALQCGQPVYLHCAMGYSRSRQIAASYLARHPASPLH